MNDENFAYGPSTGVFNPQIGQKSSPLMGLLHSRKFWLAVFGVVQTVVSHYFAVPVEVWGAVDTLVGVLIAAIAAEDAAEKR